MWRPWYIYNVPAFCSCTSVLHQASTWALRCLLPNFLIHAACNKLIILSAWSVSDAKQMDHISHFSWPSDSQMIYTMPNLIFCVCVCLVSHLPLMDGTHTVNEAPLKCLSWEECNSEEGVSLRCVYNGFLRVKWKTHFQFCNKTFRNSDDKVVTLPSLWNKHMALILQVKENEKEKEEKHMCYRWWTGSET